MDDVLNRSGHVGQIRPAQSASDTSRDLRRRLATRWKLLRQWLYIHARRLAHTVHGMTAGSPLAGPVSFLAVSAALGVALTITTLYSSSYAVSVNGEQIGVVADQSVVTSAIAQVERQGSRILGTDYQVEGQIEYQFALTLKSQLDSQRSIENYFYEQLDEVSAALRKYQVTVNGVAVGTMEDKAELEALLEEL
jgi:hypothetical protein